MSLPESDQRNWKQNRPTLGAVLVLMAVHIAFGIHSAASLSITNDEFWHLPVGYWNLTTGRFHYENLNPPLARCVAAIPLLLAGAERGDVQEPASKEQRADAFVAANRDRFELLLTLGRTGTLLLSALTAWVLATWALELFGRGAAVLAAAMWCLSPNVLAHGSLVTTDAAAALAMLVVIRQAWKFSESPTTRNAVFLGLFLGLAQLTKFTCLLAVPLIFLVWLIRRWQATDLKQTDSAGAIQSVKHWAAVIVISLIVLNSGYLFRGTGRAFSDYRFRSATMNSIANGIGPLGSLPLPLPVDYVEGVDRQQAMLESEHPAFLDGELRFEGGFPDYYRKAIWYKVPHATQLLCVLGLITVLWLGREDRRWRLQLVLLLPIALLLYIAGESTMQLGVRYILPVVPFAFLFASQSASAGIRRFGMPQFLSIGLAVWLACSVRYAPHHLAYFNELAGGPENGSEHLLDSNLDWGQGLKDVRRYARENNIDKIYLAYFGAINPADMDITFEVAQHAEHPKILWPALHPGTYAVSKNFAHGRPGMVRDPDGTTRAIGPYEYGFFRFFRKQTDLAYSIEVYELTEADIASMPPNPE